MRVFVSILLVTTLLTGCFQRTEGNEENLNKIYSLIEKGENSGVLKLVTKKNINSSKVDREPIFLYAASLRNEELAISLLQYKPDFAKTNHIGNTILHVAVETNLEKLVNILLEQKEININKKNDFGQTPLMYAVQQHNVIITKLLLQNGANPNITNSDSFTALHQVSSNGDDELLQLLIAGQARIDAKDSSGKTPLMYAAISNKLKAIEVLLENGADVQLKDNDGYNALAFAVNSNNIESAQRLIEARSPQDIIVSNQYSLIDLAKINQNEEMIKVLSH